MAKPKEENKEPKIKVEKIGSPKKEPKVEEKIPETPGELLEAVKPQVENRPASPLEELRAEAVSLGMPKEDTEKFESAELLQATINTLKTVKADVKVSIEEKPNPKEERQTEIHWRSKADRQKAYFDSLIPVRMLIPCEGEEKPGVVEEKMVGGRMQTVVISGAVWSKTFNGYKVIIPKGVYVNVRGIDPATDKIAGVAENIQDEFSQVQKSNERFSIDRIDPKTGRPVRDQL